MESQRIQTNVYATSMHLIFHCLLKKAIRVECEQCLVSTSKYTYHLTATSLTTYGADFYDPYFIEEKIEVLGFK